MTSSGATTAPKPAPEPGERGYLTWLSLIGVWALAQVLVLAIGASPVFEGGLIGTDGYMRLVRVELLHETGAWFDGTIARSNAPFGDTLHWTRPFDVLILGATWLLSPFLGFERALFWGGSFVSPLLLLATGYAMIWAANPLVEPENRPFLVFVRARSRSRGSAAAAASTFSRPLRSCLSVVRDTNQPSPRSPTIQSTGVFASVKNTSLKPLAPVICLSGRTSTPVCFIGISR